MTLYSVLEIYFNFKYLSDLPVDTGRKLNVHKRFRRRLIYVQFPSCLYGVGVQIQLLVKYIHFYQILFTEPNAIESLSKLLKQSPIKNLLQACSLVKNRLRRSCFPVIFMKFFRTLVAPKVVSQQLFFFWIALTQLIFTYSNSTIEKLEKGVKYV